MELSTTGYELLRVLSLGGGRVATYDTLLRRVSTGRGFGDPKVVRAFVKRVRKKLGDNATYIVTERGVGYRMAQVDDL